MKEEALLKCVVDLSSKSTPRWRRSETRVGGPVHAIHRSNTENLKAAMSSINGETSGVDIPEEASTNPNHIPDRKGNEKPG
jgi:hypothetical protein